MYPGSMTKEYRRVCQYCCWRGIASVDRNLQRGRTRHIAGLTLVGTYPSASSPDLRTGRVASLLVWLRWSCSGSRHAIINPPSNRPWQIKSSYASTRVMDGLQKLADMLRSLLLLVVDVGTCAAISSREWSMSASAWRPVGGIYNPRIGVGVLHLPAPVPGCPQSRSASRRPRTA